MELTREAAESALKEAIVRNPGAWAEHSRYVARACERIAARCPHLDADTAYIYGLLHDIGRREGVSAEKHMLDGYRFCMAQGWEKAAQICVTHGYMIQDIATSIGAFDMPSEDKAFMAEIIRSARYDDYDRLAQLCDALATPAGFCLLETRFVDVALRYGVHPATIPRWKAVLDIKAHFEGIIGCSVYKLLPGAAENCLR